MQRRHLILLPLFMALAGVDAQQAPVTIPAPVAAPAVPAPPSGKAAAFVLQDYISGQIIAGENVDQRVDPASLTKMMTVYVAGEELAAGHIKLTDMVRVSEKAWRMPGSRMFIEVNKEVSVDDLLKGVIIQSGNDASVALAEHISGSEEVFATLMNQAAARLGMLNSHFINSSGMPDEQHYSTARDLAMLAVALVRDHPELYAMHAQREFTYNNIVQRNRNQLLWQDPTVDGIKTGHTQSAGYCLVASAQRDGRRLVSVVMGAESEKSRTAFSRALLDYGFRFYETHKLYAAGEHVTTARVWKGDSDQIAIGLEQDLYVTIPRGQFGSVEKRIALNEPIVAPVNAGEHLGTVSIRFAGNEIAQRPLIARTSVIRGGLLSRMVDGVMLMWK
jgi:D-alanyl-D-alanine carboxypeptidase (penicillin-binding protein 5/6)